MDITPAQAEALKPIVARHLRFYGKLCKRLDALGISPTDELYLAIHQATDRIQALSVRLHYATCESGVCRAPKE